MPLRCNSLTAEGRMTDGRAAMIKALIAAILLVWTNIAAAAQTAGEVQTFGRAVSAMQKGDMRAALLTGSR